ncbi:hypothetical protein LX32DRAFT_23648 [Colletotrichum zoysiae]|uniref:Uncharacterized protein n=1 Tax=Colletotrichum zoysiae TaxID=1216348 RepID=A0AAD9HTA1_9PEZI|nr:hypothetical protein LX32DRAFT_23648 [Colletotrichum zoysiae]
MPADPVRSRSRRPPSRNNELTDCAKKVVSHRSRPHVPEIATFGGVSGSIFASSEELACFALPIHAKKLLSTSEEHVVSVLLIDVFGLTMTFHRPSPNIRKPGQFKSASPPSVDASKTLRCGESEIDTAGQTGIGPQPDVIPPPSLPRTPNLFVPGFT